MRDFRAKQNQFIEISLHGKVVSKVDAVELPPIRAYWSFFCLGFIMLTITKL